MQKIKILLSLCFFLSINASAFDKENIIDTLSSQKNFSTLVNLIEVAGLTDDLKDARRVTLFAPTDQAFQALPKSTVDYLLNNPEELAEVLLYHVTPKKLTAKKVLKLNEIKTLAGKTIGLYKDQGTLSFNQTAKLVKADIKVSNGVIHTIDGVLTFDADTPDNDIVTEQNVDLKKYLGTWYEIARYKNEFQTGCYGTKANYSINWAGYIRVRNTCQLEDGTLQVGKALATVKNKKTNATLKVSFVPILNLFGFFAGDYNILHLGPDYDYVLVGDTARSNFWILARDKEMPEALYQDLLDIAEEKGYRKDLILKSPLLK
jgi:apolipoprotein D and lipocalin family protein